MFLKSSKNIVIINSCFYNLLFSSKLFTLFEKNNNLTNLKFVLEKVNSFFIMNNFNMNNFNMIKLMF